MRLSPIFGTTKRNVMVCALSCLWDEAETDTHIVEKVDKDSQEQG
jgi:hypothetical protein